MKVAVTGVGGTVGQSIMKALSISNLKVDVVPIDVQPYSAGLFMGEEGMVLPKPEDAGALDVWEHRLGQCGVDTLIPGSDHDLLPLSSVREDWEARNLCNVLVSDRSLIQVCRDKALTGQTLEKAGIPAPKATWGLSTEDACSWAASNGYPVVIKPRDGSASRMVNIVQDEEEFRFFYPRTTNPMVQEYLTCNGEVEEYTCAVFVNRDGHPVSTFMARRELSGGTTYRAEIGFWPSIHEQLLTIGSALRPRGVLNVQLRMTASGPVPFELNIRCSATTGIRAYYGYNEPEMLLRHYVLGEELETPKTRPGYVFRYWNEVFLEVPTASEIEDAATEIKGDVLAWP